MNEERLRGMLLGLVLADRGVLQSTHDDTSSAGLGTEFLASCMASLLDRHGFDGADQARRLGAVVASNPAAATPLERLVAGMFEDGAVWDDPARVLCGAPDATSHHAAVRALAAAVLAWDNDNYRPWLAERLVALTHQSDEAITAAVIAADAAAALLTGASLPRGESASTARLAAVQPDGTGQIPASTLVLTVVGIAAAAPDVGAAVRAVASHAWADQRAVALAGALAGASRPRSLPQPQPAARAAVERLEALGDALAGGPCRHVVRARGA